MNFISEALELLNKESVNEDTKTAEVSSIKIDGKDYPIRDKSFLDGKLSGYGNSYGLEHVLNVKYRGKSYKIYDSGFSNLSSKDRCAVLDES